MRRSRAWTTVLARTAAVATTAAAAAMLAGCQPPPTPPPAPPPPPPKPMSVPQQRSADAARFRDALSQYDAHVAMLPGHTEGDHRAAAAAALSDLAAALPVAYGAGPSPAFTADVNVVAAAATTVSVTDVPRARMAAAENQALHAAVSGLRRVADHVLYDDADLPPLLDTAAMAADAGRSTLGPLHDADATSAFGAIGVALHRVDDDFQQRFANVAEPPPSPSALPTLPPMPRPVTPATMPTPALPPLAPTVTPPPPTPTTIPPTPTP